LRTFYDMLSVAQDAPPDEIKKAFRREIARYHPDKVQHLGPEFQDMAAGIAADLTEAYRVLMDPALRAKYDQEMRAGPVAPPARPRAPQPSAPPPAPPGFSEPIPTPTPPRPTAGLDLIKRAALSKIREAVQDVLGTAESFSARDFDMAFVTRPKKSLFKKPEDSVCVVVRFVPFVDPEAIAAVWGPASKLRAPGAAGCAVILLGAGLAPARDLAATVSDQRRKARGTGPLLVPVDVRDWDALFPPETPGAVRSLIQRLKDGKQ
jgi:hypothetical protein